MKTDLFKPYSWNCEAGVLSVVAPVEEPVVDFLKDRHAVVRGSVSTPPGGVRAKVLSEAQFLAGEDATGTMVMLEPETHPSRERLTAIIDCGALGFISDFTPERFERPDEIPLIVGATENGNEAADAETRDFVGFAVSPRMGVHLRTLAMAGTLFVHVECVASRTGTGTEISDVPPIPPSWGLSRTEADVSTPWRKYAATVIARNVEGVLIRHQVKLPKWAKVAIPEGTVREVLDWVTLAMDGKTDLATLISSAEAETGRRLDESQVRKIVLAVSRFGEAGYFNVSDTNAIDGEQILAALKRIGIKKGDVLLLHSSLTAFGYIAGGAKTVLDAIMEAVGSEGTVLMPSFIRSECWLNGISKRWDHRPANTDDWDTPSMRPIGILPMEFLRLYPEKAIRGRHLSHPWCGWGKDAAGMLAEQGPEDPPDDANSALAAAVRLGAKILHFGSPVGHTTFVHYFENFYNLPGIGPGFFAERQANGKNRYFLIPKSLPGPREFYVKNENARFFREAVAKGLRIDSVGLGLGSLKLIDCRDFWRIGSELVKADPWIIVGDC